ncbi:O-antigen polysaccharide polymerase Wzy [Microbacterium terricola]|uniref:O-antigen polysaccharide polymerase Wzy n=1 Tax=Microbacterium terricola TaxID=344163 RepID=UPI0021E969A6|nr:O-antigen polysaccharide polymerase Wzy [Microbacterium terricola]UYK39489.1 O-antigen polysaccharide polymerase Wzy [Microbacterium terricola]
MLVIIIVVLLLGYSWAPSDSRGTRPLFSAYSTVLLAFAIYIPFPATLILIAGDYTWATGYYSEQLLAATLGVSLIALVAFIVGNVLARGRNRLTETPESRLTAHTSEVLLVLMVLVGVAMKVALVLGGGGVENALIRLSSFASVAANVEEFGADEIGLRTLSGVADGAATWGLVQGLRDRRRVFPWTIVFVAVLAMSYFTIGKRLLLILPLVCVAVAVHNYVRPITVRLLPLAFGLILVAGLSTLFARIFLPAAAAGVAIDLNQIKYADGSALAFYFYSLEFSTVEMISVAIRDATNIASLFGGSASAFITTNLVPFLYSIPRSIWPGKPAVFYDVSYGVSAALGATPFEDPTVGYASTAIGTSYIVGGVLGVIAVMFVFGMVTARVDRSLHVAEWSIARTMFYAVAVVIAFHFFRQGTLAWTFIVSIVQQYGLLLAFGVAAVAAIPRRARRLDLVSGRSDS